MLSWSQNTLPYSYITHYGRFIAVITPLKPGRVKQRALAAIAREITEARTANQEITEALNAKEGEQ